MSHWYTSALLRRLPRIFRRWPRGIRARLTLWYVGVFALVFALFGLAFCLNVQATLTSSVGADLRSRTAQIAAGITQRDSGIEIDDVTGTLPGLAPGYA